MTCEAKIETSKPVHTLGYRLSTELDLALSFLKTARVLPSGKTKQSYQLHAMEIHREVAQQLLQTHIPSEFLVALDRKLLSVQAQIAAVPDTF